MPAVGPRSCHLLAVDVPTAASGGAKLLKLAVEGLLKMLKALARGDVVTVTRIDRLARSTFDLFGIVKCIVDAEAQFRSLAEPWADTGTSTGRLMLAVLGGLADVERDLIRTRTGEGRSRAQARGQHMGRPPSLLTHRHSRKRPPDGARRVLRCRNWLTATM
jgi:DNA invertase Pin-like site-specific DNA recombinase